MRCRALAVAAVVASLAVLAGCGDDGGKDTSAAAKAFCDAAKPVQDFSGVLEHSDDPKAVQSIFAAAETALAKVSSGAPEAIKADVDVVSKTFATANPVVKKANYDIDVAGSTDAKAVEALDDAGFHKAADNIQAWARKNCEGFN